MKALVLREHGGLDKLRIETDFPDPVAREDEAVLRVRVSFLNCHDVFTRRGMPGIRLNFPVIIGLDVAGEIASVGPVVTGWSAGVCGVQLAKLAGAHVIACAGSERRRSACRPSGRTRRSSTRERASRRR